MTREATIKAATDAGVEGFETYTDMGIYASILDAREAMAEALETVVRERKAFYSYEDYADMVDGLWDLCKRLEDIDATPLMVKEHDD